MTTKTELTRVSPRISDEASVSNADVFDAEEPLITFYRAFPSALPAMRADRSALGTLPAKAYQYCEAVCAASGYGWYAFPAADIQIWFDGVDLHRAVNDSWEKLDIHYLSGADEWWNTHCPDYLDDLEPPFVTSLGVPGFVQIWSGLLVETQPNWSVHVRPIANVEGTRQFFCFEGIVETDVYGPAPLFINLKIQDTREPVLISANEPLFMVQPVHRASYSKKLLGKYTEHDIADKSGERAMTAEKWAGYRNTVRKIDPRLDDHKLGQYASKQRKRTK